VLLEVRADRRTSPKATVSTLIVVADQIVPRTTAWNGIGCGGKIRRIRATPIAVPANPISAASATPMTRPATP